MALFYPAGLLILKNFPAYTFFSLVIPTCMAHLLILRNEFSSLQIDSILHDY